MSTSIKYEHAVSFVYTPSFCGVVTVLRHTCACARRNREAMGIRNLLIYNFQKHRTTNPGTLPLQLASYF